MIITTVIKMIILMDDTWQLPPVLQLFSAPSPHVPLQLAQPFHNYEEKLNFRGGLSIIISCNIANIRSPTPASSLSRCLVKPSSASVKFLTCGESVSF